MSEENRERIIRGAMSLFMEQGIKTVTMDKIAAFLVVSKRTIYEHFNGKEELVQACLEQFKKENDEKMEQLRAGSENSFLFLLSMFRTSFSTLQKINVNFFLDVEAMFPSHMEQVKLSKPAQIKRFAELIEESQRDGYIDDSLSPNVLSVVYYGMLSSLRNRESYDFSQNSYTEILRVLVITFFKGVAFPKGLKLIEEYTK